MSNKPLGFDCVDAPWSRMYERALGYHLSLDQIALPKQSVIGLALEEKINSVPPPTHGLKRKPPVKKVDVVTAETIPEVTDSSESGSSEYDY
jgi:hypothetical protein